MPVQTQETSQPVDTAAGEAAAKQWSEAFQGAEQGGRHGAENDSHQSLDSDDADHQVVTWDSMKNRADLQRESAEPAAEADSDNAAEAEEPAEEATAEAEEPAEEAAAEEEPATVETETATETEAESNTEAEVEDQSEAADRATEKPAEEPAAESTQNKTEAEQEAEAEPDISHLPKAVQERYRAVRESKAALEAKQNAEPTEEDKKAQADADQRAAEFIAASKQAKVEAGLPEDATYPSEYLRAMDRAEKAKSLEKEIWTVVSAKLPQDREADEGFVNWLRDGASEGLVDVLEQHGPEAVAKIVADAQAELNARAEKFEQSQPKSPEAAAAGQTGNDQAKAEQGTPSLTDQFRAKYRKNKEAGPDAGADARETPSVDKVVARVAPVEKGPLPSEDEQAAKVRFARLRSAFRLIRDPRVEAGGQKLGLVRSLAIRTKNRLSDTLLPRGEIKQTADERNATSKMAFNSLYKKMNGPDEPDNGVRKFLAENDRRFDKYASGELSVMQSAREKITRGVRSAAIGLVALAGRGAGNGVYGIRRILNNKGEEAVQKPDFTRMNNVLEGLKEKPATSDRRRAEQLREHATQARQRINAMPADREIDPADRLLLQQLNNEPTRKDDEQGEPLSNLSLEDYQAERARQLG